jgi:hypothetical protein
MIQSALAALEDRIDLGDGSLVSYGFGFRTLWEKRTPCLVLTMRQGCVARPVGEELHGFPVLVETGACPRWSAGGLTPKVRGGDGIVAEGTNRLGTLGCFVEREGAVYGLTCEHVLANAKLVATRHTPVSWCKRRTGSETTLRRLGEICETGDIDYQGKTAVSDSALVTVECPHSLRVRSMGRVRRDPIDGYLAVATRARVQKSGVATGVTSGRVEGIVNITVEIHDSDGRPVQRVWYPKVLEILSEEPWDFFGAGDSGAMFWVVDEGRLPRPLGLLCSTSLGYKGYAIPIQRVLDRHRARILGVGGS